MRERARELVGFESIPESSERRSWCDDVWQTVSETATEWMKAIPMKAIASWRSWLSVNVFGHMTWQEPMARPVTERYRDCPWNLLLLGVFSSLSPRLCGSTDVSLSQVSLQPSKCVAPAKTSLEAQMAYVPTNTSNKPLRHCDLSVILLLPGLHSRLVSFKIRTKTNHLQKHLR